MTVAKQWAHLFAQVSQVYQSIELSRLAELAPFATPLQLEKVVVETAHSNNIQVLRCCRSCLLIVGIVFVILCPVVGHVRVSCE